MISKFRKAVAAMLALALMLAPSGVYAQGAGPALYFWFQAVNEENEPFQEEGAVRCSIYSRDATTGSSIVHSTAQLTNPYTLPLASDTSGRIHWYSGSSDPVNLKCFTQYGDYAYKNNFSRSRHVLRIDTSNPYKIFRFPYVTNASPTATGLIVPSGGLVTDAAVEVVTGLFAPTDVHINVGFAGNHAVATRNAIVRNLRINDKGFFLAHSQAFSGANANFVGTHRGTALAHTFTTAGNNVINLDRNYMVHVSSGLEITYDTSNVAGIGGHVYIFWRDMHMGANRQPYR